MTRLSLAHLMFPIERDGGQQVQRIVCSCCRKSDRNVLTGKSAASDETLVAFFRRRGWQIKRNSFLCADCVGKAHDARREAKAEKMAEVKLSVVQPAPSPNSVLSKKIMSDLLFEHYDTQMKDYKPGWDDARVAKESGLAEPFVAQRRSQDYGPASPPRAAVINEVIGMASKVVMTAKDVLGVAKTIERNAQLLLDESERVLSVLKEHAKKVA